MIPKRHWKDFVGFALGSLCINVLPLPYSDKDGWNATGYWFKAHQSHLYSYLSQYFLITKCLGEAITFCCLSFSYTNGHLFDNGICAKPARQDSVKPRTMWCMFCLECSVESHWRPTASSTTMKRACAVRGPKRAIFIVNGKLKPLFFFFFFLLLETFQPSEWY